ncbi:hypothetical protein ACFL17_01365 [Pseudomonadota bacterium]
MHTVPLLTRHNRFKLEDINYGAIIHGVLLLLAIISCSVSAASWGGNRRDRTCSKVANAVFTSCRSEVREEYWLNYGHCLNTDEQQELEECLNESRENRREGWRLCSEQKTARLEICSAIGQALYNPEIDTGQFLDPASIAANPNPYFPLIPGMVKMLKSGDETITISVTEDTIEILGVTCIVVRDVVEENGQLVEDTQDWYAQDTSGNVWYFGELSKNYEDGELSDLDGSWKAGVDGAIPGIIMLATPIVGDIYRQEYALGEAEDMAEVVSTDETSESALAADCASGCVVTREFLPIDPDAEELKFYAPGIGNILVIDVDSGDREELTSISYP